MSLVQPSARLRCRLVAALCLLCAVSLPAWAEERLALVVGNSQYRNVPALSNPGNDGRLIANALVDSGFTLVGGGPQLDVTRPQLEALIREFGRRLTADSTALFYFAGHAVQIGGRNYLIPVEANVASANDVKYELVDADFVLDEMTSAGSRLNLLLLDACRNNPFNGRGLRGVTTGLAQVTAPTGTIIGYATQPGAIAADGDGADSPYSTALARAITTPGAPLLEALNNVGLDVQAATGGRQLPWLALSPLRGSFSFRPQSPMPQEAAATPAPVVERGIRAREPQPVSPSPPPPSAPSETRTMEICPADYDGFPANGPALTCGCTAEASTPGRSSVFGDLVYATHSSLCLAARHAGVISGRGGQITLWPAASPDADPAFPSVLRNGIQSYGTAPGGTPFRVSAAGREPAPLPLPSSAMRDIEFCPQNYHEFPVDGPPLTCGCTAEASTPGRASVFGDKVYAGNSSLCLAARHAGAITGRGGKIVVTAVPTPDAAPPFPSVLRNGIQSYGSSPLGPSFSVASAKPAAAAAPPTQSPIAETLRAEGRVQVYINFDTDKASLQPSAEPVLRELLAALTSRPELRVSLIGHTDPMGSPAHNQDLSARRAATVLTWLVQHGIVPSRLQASGLGSREPIADNNTELGRALNRRVEVKALD